MDDVNYLGMEVGFLKVGEDIIYMRIEKVIVTASTPCVLRLPLIKNTRQLQQTMTALKTQSLLK